MKKLTAILITILLILGVTSCGNHSLGLGNFQYSVIHVYDTAGNYHDYHIAKWYESNSGIEVTTTDGNNLFVSEGSYILAKDYCPLCGAFD